MLDRRPGLERTFFTLEQELLKPVYEIEDWSPDEAPAAPPAERARLEQALFARTAAGPPGGSGLHSLIVSSYPEKLQQVNSLRNAAISRVGTAWIILILTAVVGGFIWCLWTRTGLGQALACLIILGVLVGLLLPATQSAREAARRAGLIKYKSAEAPGAMMMDMSRVPSGGEGAGEEPVRVRRNFPETLLWRPELITDDQGRARLDVELADSITTWRMSMGAVAADGSLGAAQASIRVFQPFFVDIDLPTALTRGDEIGIPVVVSNYLDKPQAVTLSLRDAPWFARLEAAGERSLELKPNEVRSASFRIRVKTVGHHDLEVTARGSERGTSDAVRRPIEVVPDGRRVEQVASGTLQRPAEVTLTAPGHAIPGSVRAIVKVYPSSFSQLVEGLDAIFQRPFGCFEQTSSTTYPNVLALDYLRRTKKSVPAVEAKARQYIHLGYQRLVSFEIPGGGFDWFGKPPANRTLTAYGLMEFEDMARVHDVDPRLIERTRRWLLDQQKADGSWEPEGHMLHEDPIGARGARPSPGWARPPTPAGRCSPARRDIPKPARPSPISRPRWTRRTTTRTCWHSSPMPCWPWIPREWPRGPPSIAWSRSSRPRRTASSPGGATPIRTPLHRRGAPCFTAAVIAAGSRRRRWPAWRCVTAGLNPATVRGALSWLVAHKDGQGTWGSTQATVLALKALLAGTGKPLGGDRARRIAILLDGQTIHELEIPADQDDVLQQVDLSDRVATPGPHRLILEDRSGAESGYQVVFRYHEPPADHPREADPGPLTIRLEYDRAAIAVDQNITAVATVANNRPEPAPMVILDLPIPAGFTLDADDLSAAVKAGTMAKFQLTPRAAIVYLRNLARPPADAPLSPPCYHARQARGPRGARLRILRPVAAGIQRIGPLDCHPVIGPSRPSATPHDSRLPVVRNRKLRMRCCLKRHSSQLSEIRIPCANARSHEPSHGESPRGSGVIRRKVRKMSDTLLPWPDQFVY